MRGTRLWLVIGLVALLRVRPGRRGLRRRRRRATTVGGLAARRRTLDLLTEGTLTVGSDIPYPPFEQGNAPDYEGFDIDLINAIAEEMGLETEIVDAPFDVILAGRHGPLRPLDRRDHDHPGPREPGRLLRSVLRGRAVAAGPGGRRRSPRSTTSPPTASSAPRTGPPARPTPSENTDAEVAAVPRDRRRVQRARQRPGRRGPQRPAVDGGGGRGQRRPRGRRDVPDRRALRDRLPAGTRACVEAVNEALQTVKDNGTLAEHLRGVVRRASCRRTVLDGDPRPDLSRRQRHRTCDGAPHRRPSSLSQRYRVTRENDRSRRRDGPADRAVLRLQRDVRQPELRRGPATGSGTRCCSRSSRASLSLIWGLVLAVLRQLPGRPLAPVRWLTIAYIDVFRGVPLLLVLLIIFGSFGALDSDGVLPESSSGSRAGSASPIRSGTG